jgi:hypothetical protein
MNDRKVLTILATVLIFGGVIYFSVALYYTLVAFAHKELPPIQANLAEVGGMIWGVIGALILKVALKK